jgi:hypothetical protein
MKRKICVYVSEESVTRLAAAAGQRGATKSGLVGVALDRFLDVADEPDHSCCVDERLAQMGQQLDHLACELRLVNEAVAMHARYRLTVTPPLPDAAQPAACRLGAARFDELAAQIGRRVDRGKPLIRETLDRLSTTNQDRLSFQGKEPLRDAAEREHHVAGETMEEHRVDTDEIPVVPELSEAESTNGPFPSGRRRVPPIEVVPTAWKRANLPPNRKRQSRATAKANTTWVKIERPACGSSFVSASPSSP